MKICPQCTAAATFEEQICPRCGFVPAIIDGFVAYAPELAKSNAGFPADSFASLARVEDRHFWFRARNELLVWTIRRGAIPARLLEIGCGTGVILKRLRSLPSTKLFGSDLYTSALPFAAARVPEAMLFQMDATAIPFADEFDMIVACDVIEHIDRDDLALANMHRALHPGGRLVLTVPQHRKLWSAPDEYAMHKRRYEREELIERVTGAGFSVTLCRSFNSLLYPLMRLARRQQRSAADYDPMAEMKIGSAANAILYAVMNVERVLLKAGVDFAFGGSLLLTAARR